MLKRLRSWWADSRAWHRQHEAAWDGWVDTDGSHASRFEASCEDAFLEAFGAQLLNRAEEGGVHRKFGAWHQVRYDLETPELTLFITDCGTVSLSRGEESLVRLEEWDAETPAELIERAISECRSALSA